MNNEHATTRHPPPATRRPRRALLVRAAPFVLLLLAALLPRLLDLGGFVNEDEARYWIGRSYRFLEALEAGDYAATAISPHPGVTTMWSGAVGILLQRKLLEWHLLPSAQFPALLACMRLPVVLVHVAGILAGYGLLRRLLPPAVALLAALLWAADPFVIGYSRLLHVDALMSTFATLSILAACCFWHHQRHPSLLLLSAACGALAVLSKSPGLIVLPVVAAIALWDTRTDGRSLRAQAAALALWGAVFVALLVLAWPAVWAAPGQVYQLFRVGVEVEGGSPHIQGNFFLGRRDDEPGLLFYPVAVALRLTPWAMIGLLLLPLVWPRAADDGAARRNLIVLAGFALLFIIALSIFSKKLNRYSMPAFPALDMLAAAGLVWAAEWLGKRWTRKLPLLLPGFVALAALVNAAWWHPYSLAYFNQALGGAPAGAATFLVGSGEGMEQAAAWLNEQPDITGVIVATTMKPVLQPYLRAGAQSSPRQGSRLPAKAGYAVLYVRNVWDGASPPFDQFYRRAVPLHTVSIHGVDYAWIYQVPPPVAQFGPSVHLGALQIDAAAVPIDGTLHVTTRWWASAPLAEDYMLFLHVLDSNGQRVGQIDVPPAGPAAPARTWQPGRYQTWTHPLPVQADLPPGNYWLAVGLYQPDTFARLPVQAAVPPDAPDAGGDALLLPLTLP